MAVMHFDMFSFSAHVSCLLVNSVFVRPGTPGPLLGYLKFRPGYFIML